MLQAGATSWPRRNHKGELLCNGGHSFKTITTRHRIMIPNNCIEAAVLHFLFSAPPGGRTRRKQPPLFLFQPPSLAAEELWGPEEHRGGGPGGRTARCSQSDGALLVSINTNRHTKVCLSPSSVSDSLIYLTQRTGLSFRVNFSLSLSLSDRVVVLD